MIFLSVLFTSIFAFSELPQVEPLFETEPVSSVGDAADDSAFWIHPHDSNKSVIVATDKKAGLLLYSLDGRKLSETRIGLINNIDIVENVHMENRTIQLLAGSDRGINAIALFTIEEKETIPSIISLGAIALPYIPYGICFGRTQNGETSVFVTTKEGEVAHWALNSKDKGVKGHYLRSWRLSGKTESCKVDTVENQLYVSEEARGLWKLDLSEQNKDPVLVDEVSPRGHLVADVEGVAIYRSENSKSYLVVSSQGDNSFHVYNLSNQEWLGAIKIGKSDLIDEVTDTDGIEILNPGEVQMFPNGLLLVQDGENDSGTKKQNQNFKAVDWKNIESVLSLHSF